MKNTGNFFLKFIEEKPSIQFCSSQDGVGIDFFTVISFLSATSQLKALSRDCMKNTHKI
jgi:hypothetical protein